MKQKREALARVLDLPASAMPGVSQIELLGSSEAVVEGCRGVLEYKKETVRLRLDGMCVTFTGRGLDIRLIHPEQALIAGEIESVVFSEVRV